jgi:hypothetical protein
MRTSWMVGWALALTACGDKADDTGTDGLSAADRAAGEAMWEALDGFEDWPQVEGWEGIVDSTSVHLDQVQIWVNPAAADTIDAGAGDDMPDGAITVKAAYRDGETSPANYTAMRKAGGAWEYARFSPDGTVEVAGQSGLDTCQGCHAAGQDEVLFVSW